MTVSPGTAAIAWRYALASLCIGLAVLLHLSPAGPLFHPMGLFILAVVAAAWFGGAGPGVFAAFLSALVLPHLIAVAYPLSLAYPLLAGVFDLPRFITLGLTGGAVGWGTSSLRRAEKALRERERELRKTRDELETTVAARTAHLAASEEALREWQQRHERVMLASNAGIWDWDVAKDEFYVSPRFLEMGGLPPDTVFSGREDFMRRGPLHPEDREKWKQAVRQLFASGGSRLSMELRSIVKGETRWRRLEGICFRDASGRVVRWTGSTVDISERKRAEEALRRSEERFALALAASNDGIWDWDIVTDQQFFSGRAQRTLGLEPGPSVRPRSEWHALREYHPEDAPRRVAALERHLAGDTPVYEGEWRVRAVGGNAGGNPGGEYRWIHARGLCVRDAEGRAIRMVGSLTDIDGRKRMEAALRQSEERYSLAMEATEEGHFDVNVDTGGLFTSERLNEIYGFAPGTHFDKRRDYLKQFRFYGNDADTYHAAIYAAEAKGGPERYEFEYRILRPSGEVRWLRTRGKVTRDAEGRARRRTGVVADITEAKLAQDALLQSQERYALAMDAAADGHTDWNLVTGEFYISPRLLRILGYAQDTTFADRADWVRRFPFHPEDRPRWETAIAAHFAGRDAKFRMDLRIVVRGETRWVAFTFIASRDPAGKPVRWTGTITDIQDAKLAEEALRESQERYSLAVAGSDDGVWDCDFAARHAFISSRARELAGMPPGPEVVPLEEWFASLPLHPDDLPLRAAALHAHLSGATPAYEGEFRLRQPDGTYRWRRLHGLCLRDADGHPHRMAGSISDVDARRRAEEALRLSEARYALAMEVAEEGHFDWNVQTDEIFASAQGLRVIGLPQDAQYRTRGEVTSHVRYHPDDWPRISAEWRDALAGRGTDHEFEYRILRRDEPRTIRGRWKVFRDETGAALRVIGVVADITPRKLAEEARRLSEERYALAMEASEEGHFDWNVQTDEIFASASMKKLLGLPADAEYRTRADMSARVHYYPGDRERLDEMTHRVLASDAQQDEFEYRILRGAEVRWVHRRWKIIRDAAGAALRVIGVLSDFTERKLAEEALRRSEAALRLSEERYAFALEASEEGHFDNDLQTGEIFVSARVNEIYGFARQARTLNRIEFLNQIPFHPDDRHVLAELSRPDWENPTGDLYEIECRIVPRPGETRWIHSRAKVVRDAEGRARRRVGVVADITERKLAEEALRLSEERYAYAMEAAQDAHWDWIIGTDQYYTSPRVVDVFGLPPGTTFTSRQDYLTKTPLVKEDLDVWLRASRELIAGTGSRLSMELRAIIHGEVRWIQHNGLCVRDASGNALRWCGSVRDVTERRRAEEALRQSQERYALAVEGSNEGLFDWDLVSDRVYVSYRAQELFGLPHGELWRPRRDWRHIVTFHPDDAPRLHDSIKAHVEGGAPTYDQEFRIVLPGGAVRWFRQRGIALRDASGKAYRMVGSIGDITERKLAENALRESEFRFRTLVELNSNGFWEQDENLRYVSSPVTSDVAGYDKHGMEGKTRWELCGDPTPLSGFWAVHQAELAARRPFRDFEYRRLRPDGEIGYYSASGAPIFDDQGRFKGYYGVAEDITERKRFEEELRSRKEMLELAQKSARAVPWQWTNGGHPEVNKWSPELSAMFGLPPGAFDGTAEGWWKLCHPDDLPRVKASIAHALATGEIDVEYRVCHPDGKVHWLNQKGRAFFDANGKPVRSIGFMFDVTERRKVEDDLRSRQEMLDLAQKAAQAIAFEWKIGEGEGENRWSPDLEVMYGLTPGSYDGTLETWKKLVHPEDWPAVKEAIQHAHRTGDVASEYRVVHPDGAVHWLQAKGRMFFDAAGNATRMVGFMQDITQRKRAEEELRKMEQELRRAQRLEAMGTLAGGIAHDFNNILGAILGYGEMAMRDAKKGTRLHRDMDAIMAAGERGRALVDRILAFSRSGVGERVPVHVEEVVREALDQLAAKLPESVTIAPRLRAGRAAMLGDSTQVHQVVMNLANNAVQAMPQGGVLRVSLDTLRMAPRAALIGAISAGEHVVLRVTDSGTGIAAGVLERMFDPFFTTKEVGVGTGLGLSLVHGIVATVGGAIDVATELGKGTTFTVYLPRSGDAPAKATDENRPLPRGEGERVLVVDDEEPLVRLATETLESLGYAPVGFTSSVNALHEFGANPGRFDAILTDERMPGVTGSAIIREVRRINPSIPILLMSGFVGGAAALKARELGANDVLKKPLLARELATSLARVLRP